MYGMSYKRISEENGRYTIGISQGVPLDMAYVFFYTKMHILLGPFLQLDFFSSRKNGTFFPHYDSLRGFPLFHHISNLLNERYCS